MVNYNEQTKIYEFYPTRVSYFQDDVPTRVFTNSASLYNWVITSPGVTRFKVSNVVPDEKQIARLQDLNNLPRKEELSGFIDVIWDFIEYGYLDYKVPDFATPLRKKHEDAGRQYLYNKYKKLVSRYKHEKAFLGVKYKDIEVSTLLEDQLILNGILSAFQAGSIKETEFKARNGWFILNQDEFTKLINVVHVHVQNCFKAEKHTMDILDKKNLDELALISPSYLPKGADSASVTPINRLKRLFDREYTKLIDPSKVVDNVMEEPVLPTVYPGVDNDGNPLPSPGVKSNTVNR